MTDQKILDITEREIVVGSWIAQAYALGRCPALKIAQVLAFTDKGEIRVQGYERYSSHWIEGVQLDKPVITWAKTSVTALSFPERMCIIDSLPASLAIFLDAEKNKVEEV